MKQFLFIFLFIPALATKGQLKPANIFSDDMVLQRNRPIHIWGKAEPGKTVEIFFANKKIAAIAGTDSAWMVEFGMQKANAQPQSVIINSGNEKIVLKNILIGDIWLCLGQSNMEWPMMKEMHFKEELQNVNQPKLRLYNPTYAGKNTFNVSFSDSIAQNLTTGNFYKGRWQTCDSSSIKTMSAVGYYFGKEVINSEDIPVGLINLSIGGAPLETFISIETLKSSNKFSNKINGDWLLNNTLPVWIRERGNQNVGSVTNVPEDEYGKNHAFKPGFAFASGIAPITNLPIKGIIFYQGESNAQEMERVNEYAELFKLMVNDYRKKWKRPKLPFYYVQLSSIDSAKYKSQFWPQFRDEQRKLLTETSNSGMAVSLDIGTKNDVHPTNKKLVGQRLAKWALTKAYHENIIPSGPLPLKAIYVNGKILISFQYTGNGLKIMNGTQISGFSIDGRNEARAIIQRKTIVITAKEKPEFVFYGWEPFSNANLANSENLPASTFKIRVD
jgi:sialate O-acetylesterase